MSTIDQDNKVAFMTYVELVLMRHGNINYNLIVSKLQAHYNCGILESLDHPEYLRDVLKEIHKNEYQSIIDEIRIESERLVDMDEFKDNFFKIMLM
ncbi:hypothetical protein [Candidatus Nitrosotalea okcheonensis]|uniref:Nitrosopumilus output domain-containing protein n=1 Tax=Candidatus Nitrosotalea okcheonensis TaxID=1903276 RepID=A0A2H1FE19_9ARCH|nr:hypothetical protein [Candidatus Nitrosotalea okcheonensis]SMH71000.1 conserved protein of unknown function [Candidatus Nitrosotalea okcheonensis]